MPMIGFPMSVTFGDDPLAGFPSNGLAALYKCDDLQGSRFKDATGNWPDLVPATGVMLDAAAGDCSYVDTTGLLAKLVGQTADAAYGFEIETPTLSGGAKTMYIIGPATSGGSSGPVSVAVNEVASGVYQLVTSIRTTVGGTTASTSLTINTAGNYLSTLYLDAESKYIIVGRIITSASGVAPQVQVSVMKNCDGVWRHAQSTPAGTAGAHVWAGTGAIRTLSVAAGNYWTGKIGWAFLALGDFALSTLRAVGARPGKTNIRNILGEDACFWDFRAAEAKVIERITDTIATVSGTPALSTGLAGCTQVGMRQGNPYYGKPGVRLGGEAGFAPGGFGAVDSGSVVSIDSRDGWAIQFTGCCGPEAPAASRTLVWATAEPKTFGATITDPLLMPGVGWSISTTGQIFAHCKKSTTDDGTANPKVLCVGSGSVSLGRLATYTITCAADGTVSAYRQEIGESAPTELADPPALWDDPDFHVLKTIGLRIGDAAFDADATIGYIAIHNRPLSTAEMAQSHRMAIARMKGEPAYAAKAAGLFGNGTESFPYEDLRPIWRQMQPNRTVYAAAGVYEDRADESSSTLMPASFDFTFRGAGPATTSIIAVGALDEPPYYSAGGSKYWYGVKFDADDISTRGYDGGISNTTPFVYFYDCHFANAKNYESSGSGMVSRALYVWIEECEAYGSDSHGVYLRIEDETQGNHHVVVHGLTCYDNGEDGLKFNSDSTDPDMASEATFYGIVDRLTVTGGLRQLWLDGVDGMDVSNLLLIDSTNTGTVPGALRLGSPLSGETGAFENNCKNTRIWNVTIVGAAGYAVYDARSVNTTIQNLICSGCAEDYGVLEDGTAVITYAAGDADTNKLPAHATNILDATILFTNSGTGDYTLTSESDGYGTGINLTGLSDEVESDLAGDPRPSTGAWNMGAY